MPVADPTSALLQALLQMIGSQGSGTQNTNGSGTSNTDQTSNTSSSGTQTNDSTSTNTATTTGTTNQQQTGTSTNNQAITGTGSQNTSSQQNVTGNQQQNTTQQQAGTSLTKTSGDIAALMDVYAKQSQGVTPDMLAAIFQEGSRQVPGLANAMAGAVGARTVNNDPLATALNDLGARLSVDAASLNRQMLSDAGTTAGRLAEATRTQETANTGTISGSTDTVNNQLVNLMSQILTQDNKNVITEGQTTNNTTGTNTTQGTNTVVNTGTTNTTNNGTTNTNTNTNTNNQNNVNTNSQNGVNLTNLAGTIAAALGISGYNSAGGIAGLIKPIASALGLTEQEVNSFFSDPAMIDQLLSVENMLGDPNSGLQGIFDQTGIAGNVLTGTPALTDTLLTDNTYVPINPEDGWEWP